MNPSSILNPQSSIAPPTGIGGSTPTVPSHHSALRTPHSALLGLSNESTLGADGWVKLAAYCDYPLTREVRDASGATVVEHFIQRVSKSSATALANAHNSLFGKLRKLRRGAPILCGHADRWDIAAEEGVTLVAEKPTALENTRLGIFARLDARADGLYGLPIFADDAQQVIERDGLKFFSPFWWTSVIGLENGVPVVVPTELISAALTDTPNLKDSPALANARTSTSQPQINLNSNSPMSPSLQELCQKHGVALANEDLNALAAALRAVDAKFEQRVALENNALTRLHALENEMRTERETHQQARAALENEIAQANELACDLAIAEGRLAPAERRACLEGLKTGGATARQALLNETVKFKVVATTTDARRATSASLANESTVALANEMQRHLAAGKTKAQALDLIIKEKPEVYQAYRLAGCSPTL